MFQYFKDLRFWFAVFVAAVLVFTLSGCVSYAKVERSDGAEKCRVVVRGYFFSFNNPSALEECRSDEDR